MQGQIQAYFNPEKEGDTFKGLNGTVQGTVAPRIIRNLSEFMRESGRDYYIRKVPARVTDPFGGMDASGNMVPADRDVEGQFHLIRSSDGRVVSPHTVTGQYAPTSLLDLSEEIAPWVEAGWATPDGVYDSRGGSLEILSLRLDAGDADNMRDEFRHYAILQNAHATGGTVKGKIISWRIVCANTFARAVSAVADFAITHRTAEGDPETQTAIMRSRMQTAVSAWNRLREHVSKLSERVNTWKGIPLTLADATMLTDRLLEIEGKPDDKVSGQASNRKAAILDGFNRPQFGTYGANAYDWLNSVTFDNSSPLSPRVKVSKVSAIERIVRNTETTGSGFAFEGKAVKVLADFAGI
jgi:hypothetical protein